MFEMREAPARNANFTRMLTLFASVALCALTACSPAPPKHSKADVGQGELVQFNCVEDAEAEANAIAKATGAKIRRLGETNDFYVYDIGSTGSRRVIGSIDGKSCEKVLEAQRKQDSAQVAGTVAAVVVVLPLMVAGAMVGLDLSQF